MEPLVGSEKPMLSKAQKITSISCIGLGLIIFVFSFFIPMIIDGVIDSQIRENVIMGEGNSDLWANIPGKSKVNLQRKIHLYSPQNIMDVIFRGAKPVFVEHLDAYQLVQKQELRDRVFKDGTVQYNRYTYFLENTTDIKQFEILNPGLFAGWYVGTTLTPAKLAWMTVGQVLQNLHDALPLNLYYLGFDHSFDTKQILGSVIADPDLVTRLNDDPYMGFGNPATMEFWVRMGLETTPYQINSFKVRNYFSLQIDQTAQLQGTIRQYLKALDNSAFPSFNCDPVGTADDARKWKYFCDGKYLLALQWSSSTITNNPPIDIPKSLTVSSTNLTLHDQIELYYFYDQNYKDQFPDLKFDLDWAYNFLDRNYDYPTKPFLTEPFRLQNKGNIEYIYEQGALYDKSQKLEDLANLKDRFNMSSNEQALVVYKWLQQMEQNFAKRANLGGNIQHAVLGTFGTESLYYPFQNLSDYLLPELISQVAWSQKTFTDCQDMMVSSVDDLLLNLTKAKEVCKDPNFVKFDSSSIKYILNLCKYDKYTPELEAFRVKYDLTKTSAMQVCEFVQDDKYPKSFQNLIYKTQQDLKTQYNCQFEQCSNVEIAYKQWARGDITLNPPKNTNLVKASSVSAWNPTTFPRPFEYGYFSTEFEDIFTVAPQVLTDADCKGILNSNILFNPLQLTTAFVLAKNNKKQEFTAIFRFQEYDHLLYFIRFSLIQGMLGGATTMKTGKDLFFGYSEVLGEDLKARDPAGGGDLGTNTWVRFGDPNMTLEDSKLFPATMKTGSKNLDETRQFVNVNGFNTAKYNKTDFDGVKLSQNWYNPWYGDEDITNGTDGVIFRPFLKENSQLWFYLPQIFRSLSFDLTKGPKIFDLDTLHAELTPAPLYKNPKYNNKWHGTINLENPFQAPVVVSGPHFYASEQVLAGNVTFLNADGKEVKANDYDKTYANLEKFSGAPMQTVIQLMISMEINKDELFTKATHQALPILTLYNSGNFTESFVDEQYGQLKQGLMVKGWGWYLVLGAGLFFASIGGCIIGYAYIQWKKQQN